MNNKDMISIEEVRMKIKMQAIMGTFVSIGVFAAFFLFVFKQIPTENREIICTMLGVILASFQNFSHYVFGKKISSSKNKSKKSIKK